MKSQLQSLIDIAIQQLQQHLKYHQIIQLKILLMLQVKFLLVQILHQNNYQKLFMMQL